MVAGIPGAAILSVFSSDIAGSFVAARTLPATAVLFAEEAIETTSRQSLNLLFSPESSQPKHDRKGSSLGRAHLQLNQIT